LPIVVNPDPVVFIVTLGDVTETAPLVVLPMSVVPVPAAFTVAVGEVMDTAPLTVLPIAVAPAPVVLIPKDASRSGFGTACVGTVSVTAPVPPPGETVRFAFAEAMEVTPPLAVAAMVTTPVPPAGVTVTPVPPTI